jgi:hypothetical protein
LLGPAASIRLKMISYKTGTDTHSFHKAPHIHKNLRVKIGVRKEIDTLQPESVKLSGKT